jgi:hypothetical protein
MSLFTAPIYPRRALGFLGNLSFNIFAQRITNKSWRFLVLGASLHDILTRLKAEPQNFPQLDVIYSPLEPVKTPVVLNLPKNGIRLSFDGPEQRLRLVEVLDFAKNRLSYNNIEVAKLPGQESGVHQQSAETQPGPLFRHVYNKLLGPTFPGEFVTSEADEDTGYGLYILSYPGIAFSFPILSSAWSLDKDFVSLLSSSATRPAASMAIFDGDSWADARQNLYTQTLQDPRIFPHVGKARETYPDEIGLVKIFGEGRLEMERPWGSASYWLTLGETTPQELVAELGPPDAIYRKNDQRMMIHKARDRRDSRTPTGNDIRLQDDSTDTDQSSAHTGTDVSDEDSNTEGAIKRISDECFYNYFYHGFDILISSPTLPSRRPPSIPISQPAVSTKPVPMEASAPLVATKIILHSNVPGSYSFNRHRRCRWDIDYLSRKMGNSPVTSETHFEEVEQLLREEWESIYTDPAEAKQRQRGMVLNRGWGDSPGSSCELLGGWEDSARGKRLDRPNSVLDEEKGLGNTTLYGFPGLVFEVLKNGTVSGLTVF